MVTSKRIWLTINQEEAQKWQVLLNESGLTTDWQVDYTVGLFEGEELIATGSVYDNIIKCVAIKNNQQSQNLLALVVQDLLAYLEELQKYHSFVYTKPVTAVYFESLGFKVIVKTDTVVVLERGFPNIDTYRQKLLTAKREGRRIGAIVMNANPLTLGHQYLIETAAAASDVLYLFVVSENRSTFSEAIRLEIVRQVTQDNPKIVVLPTDNYIVSNMTFPTYFLKEKADQEIAKVQAKVDATLFLEIIAPILSIQTRWVGEEPLSPVTQIYNEQMMAVFGNKLKLKIIPRLTQDGTVISATRVRAAIEQDDWETVQKLVPQQTYTILKGS